MIRYPQMSELSTLITNSQLLLLINLKNTIDNHLVLCITNPDLNLGSFVTGQSSVYSSMLQNILKCIQQSGINDPWLKSIYKQTDINYKFPRFSKIASKFVFVVNSTN